MEIVIYWTNEFFKKFWKPRSIFFNKLLKPNFLYWSNDFFYKLRKKLYFLLKGRFYWENNFTEQSFSEKTNEIYI